ncbi:MAG: 4-(cytidine 5'-diphospho)-2-C-methyl-D-erythritol kinase [Clostridiales bacterium]|nr:4-(cytidine 5'-diphospho)-2-C-methyl-D-erythritol kinase [Clostridiales bacterium]
MFIKSRAKINITLDVVGKREDGYHDLRMIMQTINLYDMVSIRKMNAPGIKLTTNLPWLPTNENNIAYKAAKLFKESYGIKEGVSISLKKRIPVAAGLAGGSSNAAGVLVGLNRLFRIHKSYEELMKLGVQLGADVPYCIMRGTALAEGIGDKLTPLPPMPECYILLAKPGINVSTVRVFKELDLSKIDNPPLTDVVMDAIRKKDVHTIARNMCNVLEVVTENKYPIIKTIKDTMIQHGALGAIMSGSGPTVFGIYDNKKEAYNTAHKLKLDASARDVFVTTIYNRKGE